MWFFHSHIQMWELDYTEGWALKNWCFWAVVLEKILDSPLDFKEIKPVNPKGNQPWIFTGRTDGEAEAPILQPPDGKSRLTGKDPDNVKDQRQSEKGVAEDKMVRWHHWLKGLELEHNPGDSEDGAAWCAAVHGVAKSQTWLSDWTIATVGTLVNCVPCSWRTVRLISFAGPPLRSSVLDGFKWA